MAHLSRTQGTTAWLGAALLLMAQQAYAASPSAQDFARHPEFSEVVISPDGAYIAVNVVGTRSRDLGVIRLDDMQLMFSVTPGIDEHVFDLAWASDTRVLVSLASSRGWSNTPAPTGELMAIDRDGSNGRYLYGIRGTHSETKRLRDPTRRKRHGEQVSAWPDAADHALIQSYSYYEPVTGQYAFVEKMNVQTGRAQWAAQAPVRGPVDFLADRNGRVRYAQGRGDAPGLLRSFVRDPTTGDWDEIKSTDPAADFDPLTISDDGSTGYLRVREHGDRFCLERHSFATGQRERLACHADADLSGVLASPRSGHVVAAIFDPEVPEYHWLGSDDSDEALLRRIVASLPQSQLSITSRSRDGTRFIVRVGSDVDPGSFYLFDRKQDQLRFLLARRSWIDPAAMPQRRPIEWASRDGTTIRGYLTVPATAGTGPSAMVVMPHGGPFDVRDTWEWNAEAAFLASRGYLVLQPQFRGSAGFGRSFRDAARGRIGTLLIDDISDGVRALIAAKIADPQRIGLFGHSFGGYAALASATREPDLYRCMIGIAGIYDLQRYARTVYAQTGSVESRFVSDFIGESADLLRAQSPILALDQLQAPVLLFHGTRDRSVDVRESLSLRDALERRAQPVELILLEDEDHFIFDQINRERIFTESAAFLDRHLQSAETQPAPATPPQ